MDRFRSTTTDNWLDDPYLGRAFQRVREFGPSAPVANDLLDLSDPLSHRAVERDDARGHSAVGRAGLNL